MDRCFIQTLDTVHDLCILVTLKFSKCFAAFFKKGYPFDKATMIAYSNRGGGEWKGYTEGNFLSLLLDIFQFFMST